jgi:hypothetical protein
LIDGRVLIAGGVSAQQQALATAELWTLPQPAIEATSTLSAARQDHTAVLLPDGTVVVWGGRDARGTPLDTGEGYDPVTQTWAGLPTARSTLQSPTDPFQVVASVPATGTSNAPLNGLIALRFSQPTRVETVNSATITLTADGTPTALTAVAAEGGMLAFVLPQTALRPATTYIVTLQGVISDRGHALPLTTVQFTTAAPSATERTAGATQEMEGTVASQQSGGQSTNAALDKEGDDEWIPDASNRKGDWRSKRPDPAARSIPPLQAAPGVTALSGQVLTLNGKPLPRVTLHNTVRDF